MIVPLEIRDTGRLHGILLTEGRASADRKELFVNGSVQWKNTGILIRAAHMDDRGAVTGFPYRNEEKIEVNIDPSPEIRAAVEDGARYMSVEFRAIEESETGSGIREITSALLVGAAVVKNPSYVQTSAEIRERGDGLDEIYLMTL